jgi:hypothetical protein
METGNVVLFWLIIVLAVHSISHTIATQKVFKPLRDYLAPKMGDYWGELVRCPYCIAHWLVIGLLLITEFRILITGIYLLDLFILWHATVGAANYLTWILCDKIKIQTTETQNSEGVIRNFPEMKAIDSKKYG